MSKCENCGVRQYYASKFDIHWLGEDDCPFRCEKQESKINEKKSCENCGNERCKNMIVAVLYDECVESNYEKYWKPKN